MKRTFTKYPSGYVKASTENTGKWVVYYNEPIFMPYETMGETQYRVYRGKDIPVAYFDTEEEAVYYCERGDGRFGKYFEYPDGSEWVADYFCKQV